MNGGTSAAIALGLAVASIVAAIITARTTRRAHRGQHEVSLSAEARGWVTQAQSEAQAAKDEAAEARAEASRARDEAAQARAESRVAASEAHDAQISLRQVNAQTASLLAWIERIVTAAHDPEISDARFRQIVNGGPPELNALRPRLPE